jgi:F420-non-reducing hydrogenase iron-sulfur subunit
MGEGIKLAILCCNYTNLAEREDLYEVPARLEIKRFPCGGHIEITDILRAFREGAEGFASAPASKGPATTERGTRGLRRRWSEQGLSFRR